MKSLFTVIMVALSFKAFAQKETYDLVTYEPPGKGWTKAVKQNSYTSYTISNKQTNGYCQVFIMLSTASKGSIQEDFDMEWKNLVVDQYHVKEAPEVTGPVSENGWQAKSGIAAFNFNNGTSTAMLTTMSGYNKAVSIVALTNSVDYLPAIQLLLGSVEMKRPAPVNAVKNQSPIKNTQLAVNTKYAFTTTNFDDGWTSTMQEDWVLVTKGNINVLLHYPKQGTIFAADPDPLVRTAWDILVAPRYSNLMNFKTTYISTYNRPYLGMGEAIDNATGKKVFIVLFRQGSSGWLEFITPDKNSFVQQFRFDPESIQWDSETDLLNPLLQMVNYNKFAVAAGDFNGTWTSDFSGVQQLYHAYTGNYAGMNINKSNETFQFSAGNTYNWNLLAVNGMVGSMKYAQVKSAGKLTVLNNWQIRSSDIEGKPKTYHAFFSCIKGARLLHLLDAQYPGSGIYTIYGKK